MVCCGVGGGCKQQQQTSFQAGEVDGSNEGVSETIKIGAAKKAGGRLGTVYFADSRFRDNANADPAQKHQVAKWRMKQRVPLPPLTPLTPSPLTPVVLARWISILLYFIFYLRINYFIVWFCLALACTTDEDGERGVGVLSQHWRRPAGRHEALSLCASRVLAG
jgi:hypothetical protein